MSQMQIFSFLIPGPINHTILSWADAADGRAEGLFNLDYWDDLAEIAERGRFTGIFFADVPGAVDNYKNQFDTAIKYGVSTPILDPLVIIPSMARRTENLGFAATISTAALHPYTLVRKLLTLDHLTGGRIGWNIVTGHTRAEHQALGKEQIPHDKRYEYADEYLRLCHELWFSWDHDALLRDRENGIFADPDKVHVVDFDGEYLRSYGPGALPPSPQGHPVLFQAGSSSAGKRFAAKHADAVFSIQRTKKGMKKYADSVRELRTENGRSEDSCKLIFGVQPIVGATEAEAQEMSERFSERISLDAALTRLSGSIGFDFSTMDPDAPMREIATEGSQGIVEMFTTMLGETVSVRDVAMVWGESIGMPKIVGTPETVADALADLFTSGIADGFNVTPLDTPGSLERFVDSVVPILQQRGLVRTDYEADTLRGNLFS